MPIKNLKLDKHFYSISEVAEMFDVNTSLIRFWEKEFDSIKPHKNKKGNRLFTKESIEELQLVYRLVKEKGMTLKGAKQKLKDNRGETEHEQKVIERLLTIREMLVDINKEL